jgi:hypothetical protein
VCFFIWERLVAAIQQLLKSGLLAKRRIIVLLHGINAIAVRSSRGHRPLAQQQQQRRVRDGFSREQKPFSDRDLSKG